MNRALFRARLISASVPLAIIYIRSRVFFTMARYLIVTSKRGGSFYVYHEEK